MITPSVDGGFGGKSSSGQAEEATRLARPSTGRCRWREPAMGNSYDTFDPAALARIVSALGANGRTSLSVHTAYGAGEGGTQLFYDQPDVRIESRGAAWSRARRNPSCAR